MEIILAVTAVMWFVFVALMRFAAGFTWKQAGIAFGCYLASVVGVNIIGTRVFLAFFM